MIARDVSLEIYDWLHLNFRVQYSVNCGTREITSKLYCAESNDEGKSGNRSSKAA